MMELTKVPAAAITVKLISTSLCTRFTQGLKKLVPSMTITAFAKNRAGSRSIPTLLKKVAINTLHPTINPKRIKNIIDQATISRGSSFRPMFNIFPTLLSTFVFRFNHLTILSHFDSVAKPLQPV